MSHLTALREAYARQNWAILDTETTGLKRGQICQLAVIDPGGNAQFDLLVKPTTPIHADATNIHGITDEMVADATSWPLIAPTLLGYLLGKDVIVYNATYDRSMMHQSAEAHHMTKINWKNHCNFICAMEAYAEFWGDWNEYHQSYRWQRLTQACQQQGIDTHAFKAHSALGDCLMTLELVKVMCQGVGNG